jgi:hypothetical protein
MKVGFTPIAESHRIIVSDVPLSFLCSNISHLRTKFPQAESLSHICLAYSIQWHFHEDTDGLPVNLSILPLPLFDIKSGYRPLLHLPTSLLPMLSLLLWLRFSLTEEVDSLARRARQSSGQPFSSFDGRGSDRPGADDLQGISLTFHDPLIGFVDPSIRGHASASSILSWISNPIPTDLTWSAESFGLFHCFIITVHSRGTSF